MNLATPTLAIRRKRGRRGPNPGYAAVELARRVAAEPGEITVVAIGPLTSIAAATNIDADFASNVKELVVMGGVFPGRTNESRMPGEFHFFVDPEAAAAVLKSGAEIRLVGLAITLKVRHAKAHATAMQESDSRFGKFAGEHTLDWIDFLVIVTPLSTHFIDWNLTNTVIGRILPGIGNGLAIFSLRQFLMGLTESLRDAANTDGASEPRFLWSIYLSNSWATLTNRALLIFLGQSSPYLWPLLVVSDSNHQEAPIALVTTVSEHTANFGQNFAGAVLLLLVPALLMFVQQRLFGGISMSIGEK